MLAIITDTHCGARSSSNIFRQHMASYYKDTFFPFLKNHNITHILHGGDFFDNRNSITLHDINYVINEYASLLIENDVHITVVLGNHDVAFKNTNSVHSLSILEKAAPNNVTVIVEPCLKEIDGHSFALVPWINNSNYQDTVDFLNNIQDKWYPYEFCYLKAEAGRSSYSLKDVVNAHYSGMRGNGHAIRSTFRYIGF